MRNTTERLIRNSFDGLAVGHVRASEVKLINKIMVLEHMNKVYIDIIIKLRKQFNER